MSGLTDKKICVGVTLHLRKGHQSIWENGAFQNVVFLVQLLKRSPLVGEAVIVVDLESPINLPEDMMFSGLDIRVVTLEEAMQTVDLMVEMSLLLNEEWLKEFQQRGGKNVWMRVGNDYVIDIERSMFNLPSGSLCSRKQVSAVWTIPEYELSCTDYFGLTARAPIHILPHIWNPLFVKKGIERLPEGVNFGYQPGRSRWRIVVAEANICMVKTSLVPIMAIEAYYRKRPDRIEVVRVLNSQKLRKNKNFVQLMQMLDLVQHEAVSFDDRVPLFEFLSMQGDAVVSHHWENGQNYLYYEVLYGGYPLIHNSKFIKDAGYYYSEFNSLQGAYALHSAIETHDAQLEEYRMRARNYLETLDVSYEPNVKAYTEALQMVFS